jgi:hypothetical protein
MVRVYGSGGLLPLWSPPERGDELPCRRMRLAFASALTAGLCAGVALVLSSGPDASTVSLPVMCSCGLARAAGLLFLTIAALVMAVCQGQGSSRISRHLVDRCVSLAFSSR